jgi:hypothetical protein
MKRFSELNIKSEDGFTGDKIKIDKILNREISLIKYKIDDSKYPKNKSGKCLTLQIEFCGSRYVVFTGSDYLINQINQVNNDDFPLLATIIKTNDHFEFT